MVFYARDDSGWTPFMRACQYGHKDIVKLLLEYSGGNIDFNARDEDLCGLAIMVMVTGKLSKCSLNIQNKTLISM